VIAMTTKAKIRPGYRARPVLIGLLLLGFGLWGGYDGFYAYPIDNAQHAKFEQFKEKNPDTWQEDWPEYAKAEGLPENHRDIDHHGVTDMGLQYFLVAVCTPPRPAGAGRGGALRLALGRHRRAGPARQRRAVRGVGSDRLDR
jgi:hypothetical protein